MATTKRRRLNDLFITGKEVTINDGTGEGVTVWLQKLNEIDRDNVMRRANAAKARFIIQARDTQGELYQATWAEVSDYEDPKAIIDVIIADDVAKARRRFEIQMSMDEEGWGKENLISSLYDAWVGDGTSDGLSKTLDEDPNDPNALATWEKINQFKEEVTAKVKAEHERLTAEWEQVNEIEVWDKAAATLLEARGDQMLYQEYQRQELFYTVRDPDDHHKRYFETVAEIDDLSDEVARQLTEAYAEIVVTPLEGKSLPVNEDSSTSSKPPVVEVVEPAESSGPEVVNALPTSPGT